MRNLLLSGLQTGVKTTRYPTTEETAPGVSPGRPRGREITAADETMAGSVPSVVARCPTEAITVEESALAVDYRRCVHCFRCVRGTETPLEWEDGYEWAALDEAGAVAELERAFGRSLHLRIVDAGDCGACLNEIRQLNNPYYNMHRLGFFITPTPRDADVLIVSGPVTDQMRVPLQKAYEAMPTPKRVIAVGACALSGGVFGPSFVSGTGAANVVPVDVVVPGCPPPPLAILHGLLLVVGRKQPAPLCSRAGVGACAERP